MQQMPNLQPIGTYLARRRKELGISLDRAAADTKLRPRVIEAIEYTDFDAMPPEGYARASIRSYARYLGLNTPEVLRLYDEQRKEYEARQQQYSARDKVAAPGAPAAARQAPAGRHEQSANFPAQHSQAFQPSPRGGSADGRASAPVSRNARTSLSGKEHAPFRTTSSRAVDSRTAHRPVPSPSRQRVGEAPLPRRGTAGMLTATGRARGVASRQREMAEPLTVDSGYEGGSGGRSGGRNQTSHSTQQSLPEVFWGVIDAVRADRRTMLVFIGVLVVVLVVVVAVAATSCASKASTPAGTTSIPVTTVSGGTAQTDQPSTIVDTTKLNPSGIDLDAIPANSKVTLAFAADAANAVWAEVTVDGTSVYADNLQPGASLEWTVGRTLAITLSDATGVTVSVNDTQVTPTISNGMYVLNANVPQDQWVQEPAADDSSQSDDSDDGSGDTSDYQDDSGYSEDYDNGYSDQGEDQSYDEGGSY